MSLQVEQTHPYYSKADFSSPPFPFHSVSPTEAPSAARSIKPNYLLLYSQARQLCRSQPNIIDPFHTCP